MASSNTIWNEYKQLSSVHYSADDFYNQSFVDRLADAQRNIDNVTAQRNAVDAKKQQAQDSYNTFFGNMRDYSSLNDEAENEFGVTTAMENYEKSKHAVAAVEQQISALPSSINRNSNIALSQSQRELAYNMAADKWTQRMDTERGVQDVHKEAWKNARMNADTYAQELYGAQQNELRELSLQWADQTTLFQKATERIRDAEALKWNIQTDYRDWQWNQAHIQNAYARARAEDAFNRYMIQQRYESIAREEQYQRAMAESEMRMRQIKEDYAKKLVDYHFKQQQINQTKDMITAGGFLGALAHATSR